jgi:hypothetical protein
MTRPLPDCLRIDRPQPRTARQIIEARLGRKLPPARDMAKDERDAVRLLGLQLIKVME